MPTPGFIPLIGSSLDALGSQRLAWEGFNARQAQDNLSRAQAADMASNRYFENLAQMQQQEQARQDRLAEISDSRTANILMTGAREAEARRQFDIGADLQKKHLDLQSDDMKFKQGQAKRTRDEQDSVTANLGENLAPDVRDAAIAFEEAQAAHATAMDAMKTEAASQMADLPSDKVKYNPRTGEFEAVNRLVGIPKELQGQVAAANEAVARAQSAYLQAKDRLDYAGKNFNVVQQHAYQNGLIVRGKGKDAFLYSPTLNRSFGQMVEDAKAAAPVAGGDGHWEGPMAGMAATWAGAAGAQSGNDVTPWSGFGANAGGGAPEGPTATATMPPIRQVQAGTPADVVFNPSGGGFVPGGTASASPAMPAPADVPPQYTPIAPGAAPAAAAPSMPRFQEPSQVEKLYREGKISRTDALKLMQANFGNYVGNLAYETEEWKHPTEDPNVYFWRPFRSK